MEILKFDLKVPYWCSFRHFGAINIQQTYPFPPPPTIFGMIQNALGKTQKPNAKETFRDYRGYDNLNFSVVIRDTGEKLDDYANVMKGYRDRKNSREFLESELKKEKEKWEKELKESGLSEDNIDKELIKRERNFWEEKTREIGRYEIDKKLMRTQITRQRLIKPKYTVYIKSNDEGDFSLKSVSESLRDPKRPLYIGENDDMVILDFEGDGIKKDVKENESENIQSTIPGIYQNSEIVKIPVEVINPEINSTKLTVSIPKGKIGDKIPCLNVDGENIVFLR